MLTAAVTTPTFKRRRATCWSDRPRSPNLPFAQSFRPTERTVVPEWRHRSPTFNRVYPNPLCHAECARPSCPHAAAPRKMIARTIMGPIKPLLPARGPSGRSLGAREGPLAASRGMDGRIVRIPDYTRTRVNQLIGTSKPQPWPRGGVYRAV